MRRCRSAALACIMVALAACSEVRVNFAEDRARSFQPDEYERILEHWTREDALYLLDGLDNALTVSATFRSWEFRQAYMDRYAYDFRLTDEERRRLEAGERGALEASHEFWVAATATRREWSDLASADSPWEIRLVNDHGDVVEPLGEGDPAGSGIEPVVRPTPVQRAYFPFRSEFRRIFVLRFPRSLPDGTPFLRPSVEAFSLEFVGALGRAELHWSSSGR